jgi:DnaD/phage-associated family protein
VRKSGYEKGQAAFAVLTRKGDSYMQLKLKNHTTETLVPNRFIECCIGAPDKFTQAYLLVLKHSTTDKSIDFDILCARLKMSMEEVLSAFEYWQKKGVARVVNGQSMSIEFGDFEGPAVHTEEDLYTEREFNKMLQSLFGTRQLSPHDYLKVYDYTDTFGLNKKVVLALVEYCILLKGRRVSISYIDKVAKTWAEDEHIDTEQKARDYIESYKMMSSGITSVLKQLGLAGRGPTQDEYTLFQKWTSQWGFTLEAILTACAKTTAAREPSFKYLDKILERLQERGLITSRTIAESHAQNEKESAVLKEIMHLLGEPSLKPSFEHESLYQKWTTVYGFEKDILIFAAKQVGARGKKPFTYLDSVLTDWYNNRILTLAQARRYMAEQKELDAHIATVFETAGIPKTPTDAHRKIYARWHHTWGLSHDAILLAAEISTLSENPYRYLNTILSNWHGAGVKTLADAQRETKKHHNGQTGAAARESFERPVENYDHLAVNLFEDEGA